MKISSSLKTLRSCARRRVAVVATEANDAVAIDDDVAADTIAITRHDFGVEEDSRSNRRILPMMLKEEVVGAAAMVDELGTYHCMKPRGKYTWKRKTSLLTTERGDVEVKFHVEGFVGITSR